MSGVFDKKPSGVERRSARALKESQDKKKVRIIAITVVAVIALLFAGSLLLNSKFIRRTITAVTVGGVNFTAVEFDYFYNVSFQEYQNLVSEQMGEYASSLLPSSGRPLSSQIYDNETGQTWADYITEFTLAQMEELVQYHNAAIAAGYTLSDEDRAEMDAEIEEFRLTAEMYSFIYPSFDSMLQEIYGININERAFLKINEFIYTAQMYSQYVNDAFSYTEAQRDAYYQENSDSLDVFTYRYFVVNMETVLQADYDDDDEYEAAKVEAQIVASERAKEIAEGIHDEDSFIAAAAEHADDPDQDPDTTKNTYPGGWLGSGYGPWLREEERVYGDLTVEDFANGAYVVFFIDRERNEYRMPEMRQILILREDVDPDNYFEGEYDEEYIQDVELAALDALVRAEAAYDLFVEGGATEAVLLELMGEHSDDWTEGGFYDEISMDVSGSKMIEEIESWLFAEGRQYGDYELIMSEDYGYHLVFFMGFGERYKDLLAENGMRTRDYNDWKENLAPVESEKRWGFILTQK